MILFRLRIHGLNPPLPSICPSGTFEPGANILVGQCWVILKEGNGFKGSSNNSMKEGGGKFFPATFSEKWSFSRKDAGWEHKIPMII
jgi:hypothetical protein